MTTTKLALPLPWLPHDDTGHLERAPNGAMVDLEALAKALAGPTLVVEPDRFGDLILAEALAAQHHAGRLQQPSGGLTADPKPGPDDPQVFTGRVARNELRNLMRLQPT